MKTRKRNVLNYVVLIAIFIFFVLHSVQAQDVYFVSSSAGDDSYDGLAASWDGTHGPWATISKVNNLSFSAGDSILLKKGDTWCEQLTLTSSGSSGSPITYSAYGSGDNPVISGADTISGWTLYDSTNNIWVASLSTGISSVSQVFVDGGRYTLARWPNTGWNTMDSTSITGTYIYDTSLTQSDDYWLDCTVVWRYAFTFATATITASSFNDSKISFSSTSYVPKIDFGYYIEGKFEELDYAGEFYFDANNHLLYVAFPSGESPSSHSIEASVRDYGIYAYAKDYITISNINIKNPAHGIYAQYCSYHDVTDSEIEFCKSTGITYRNPDGETDLNIENNEISELDGDDGLAYGIYLRGVCNISINNNSISDISTDTLSFRKGIGIMISSDGDNSSITGNTIYNVSGGGISAIGYTGPAILISGNTIYNCGLFLSDLGAIYLNRNKTGSIIEKNYIYDCIGAGYGCPIGSNYSTAVGLYFDETDSYGAVFRNNIVSNCNFGIHLHKSYNTKVYNNTFWGNDIGISIQETEANQMYSDTIKNNICYANSSSQYAMRVIRNSSSTNSIGVFNNNSYYNPNSTDIIRYGTWSSWPYHTLSEWQAIIAIDSGNDTNSIQSDPLLEDASNDDFHLNSTSPCVDAGVDVGIDEDFDGVSVPQGDAPDIGAYEFYDTSKSATFNNALDYDLSLCVFPNPFTSEVSLSYKMENNVVSEVSIYNTNGNRLETLASGIYTHGTYTCTWNAENYPSGIYYVCIEKSDNEKLSKVLIKR